MLADKQVYRSPQALGLAYQRPEAVSDATIEAYLQPHLATPQRLHDLERLVTAFHCRQTMAVEDSPKHVHRSTWAIVR